MRLLQIIKVFGLWILLLITGMCVVVRNATDVKINYKPPKIQPYPNIKIGKDIDSIITDSVDVADTIP